MEELRKLLKKKKARIPEGTVVRFKSSIYTYAAVWAGGFWWLTGTGYYFGGNKFAPKEFYAILERFASEIEIASAWEFAE